MIGSHNSHGGGLVSETTLLLPTRWTKEKDTWSSPCFPLAAGIAGQAKRKYRKVGKADGGEQESGCEVQGGPCCGNSKVDSELGGAFDRTLVCFDQADHSSRGLRGCLSALRSTARTVSTKPMRHINQRLVRSTASRMVSMPGSVVPSHLLLGTDMVRCFRVR